MDTRLNEEAEDSAEDSREKQHSQRIHLAPWVALFPQIERITRQPTSLAEQQPRARRYAIRSSGHAFPQRTKSAIQDIQAKLLTAVPT